MTKNNIPVGTRFGHLVVLHPTDRRSGNNLYFLTSCDCGNLFEVMGSHLLHSGIMSCGCARQRPAVARPSRRLRQAWRHMVSRCSDSKCKDYVNYGARGITVCPEWLVSYDVFAAWALANGYRDNLSLDRIDNNGPYEPGNCRWATITEQNRNTRRCRHVTAFGETKTLGEWAEDSRCQVTYYALYRRVTNLGWAIEAALLNGKHERPRPLAA